MTAVHDDIGRKAVYWKTRLQPFNSAIVTVWTALSFQQSVYAGLAAYLCAFIVLLGASLLDGSAVHQLGLLLLLGALCYGLLAAWLRSHRLGLREMLASHEGPVLGSVCIHLARVECLLSATGTHLISLRAQRPLMFYLGGMVLVFVLGRLGYWLSFYALLWIAATVLLILPAALSRGWFTVPTPDDVRRITASSS